MQTPVVESVDWESIRDNQRLAAGWELFGTSVLHAAKAVEVSSDCLRSMYGPLEGRSPLVCEDVNSGETLETFAEILSLRPPMIGHDVVGKATGIVSPLDYMELRHYSTGGVGGVWKPDVVESLLEQGNTLITNLLDRNSNRLSDFMGAVERFTGVAGNINSYTVNGGDAGFSAHTDREFGVIRQVHGRKAWKLWGPDRDPIKDAPELDFVLEAGQQLLVPQGWWHLVTPVGEMSVHLTAAFPGVPMETEPSLSDGNTIQGVLESGDLIGYRGSVFDRALELAQLEALRTKWRRAPEWLPDTLARVAAGTTGTFTGSIVKLLNPVAVNRDSRTVLVDSGFWRLSEGPWMALSLLCRAHADGSSVAVEEVGSENVVALRRLGVDIGEA